MLSKPNELTECRYEIPHIEHIIFKHMSFINVSGFHLSILTTGCKSHTLKRKTKMSITFRAYHCI